MSKHVQCPDCAGKYVEEYMYSHYYKAHGKKWHRQEKKEVLPDTTTPVAPSTEDPTYRNRLSEFRRIEGFVLLTDTDGGIWIAEKIR